MKSNGPVNLTSKSYKVFFYVVGILKKVFVLYRRGEGRFYLINYNNIESTVNCLPIKINTKIVDREDKLE